MRRALKIIAIIVVVLGAALYALLDYSYRADQQRFHDARNDCERACIQDSGGTESCRKVCVDHPDHYP